MAAQGVWAERVEFIASWGNKRIRGGGEVKQRGSPLYISISLMRFSLGFRRPLASPPQASVPHPILPLGGWEAKGSLWVGVGLRDLHRAICVTQEHYCSLCCHEAKKEKTQGTASPPLPAVIQQSHEQGVSVAILHSPEQLQSGHVQYHHGKTATPTAEGRI